MNIDTFTEPKRIATQKWRDYKEAAKVSDNPVYEDLRKVYNQIKGGRKVVDITKVIQKGGLNGLNQPNLAVAKASSKYVWCTFNNSGSIAFVNGTYWNDQGRNPLKEDVYIKNCFPSFLNKNLVERGLLNKTYIDWSRLELKAPVPIIPPKILPAKLTDDYYILWEVDEWAIVPPKDPWLLRRITNTMFVALAAWDLTELERAVMAGRLV